MPLWHIYCPEGAYSPQDKRALADRITDLYAEYGLPRFLVGVVFQEVPKDSFLIGGQPADDFVRISIDQIARNVPEGAEGWWMKRIRETVAPYVSDRDLRWEVHVDATPRELWSVDGRKPPAEGSEEEQRWARENRPSFPAETGGAR